MSRAAAYAEKENDGIRCLLCPQNCLLGSGSVGLCGARKNNGARLESLIYGEVSSQALDPIEKKPLYHFYPASGIFSVGTVGCNLKCPYCQNWTISQQREQATKFYSPKDLAEAALRQGAIGVAYTYSEPIIWAEFVLDAAKEAAACGLKNVLVTNGLANPTPWKDLLKVTDALNIDLKTFSKETFARVHKGKLQNVLQNIEAAYAAGRHVEITTLVVTGINDNADELAAIAKYIGSIDKNIPWHLTAYRPAWKYNKPPTDVNFLLAAAKAAAQELNYVYCGNTAVGANTLCPNCNATLVERSGFYAKVTGIDKSEGKAVCAACGWEINIVLP